MIEYRRGRSAAGRLKPEQKAFRDLCLARAWRWALATSVAEVGAVLLAWGLIEPPGEPGMGGVDAA